MQYHPIGVRIKDNLESSRYETEVDRRLKEIIDGINGTQSAIPHFESLDSAKVEEGQFATVANGGGFSLYRKINGKLVKAV